MVLPRKGRPAKFGGKTKIGTKVKAILAFVLLSYASFLFLNSSILTGSNNIENHGGSGIAGIKKDTNNNKASSSPNNSKNVSSNNVGKGTIGFAVSVTGCGSDPITEGAAVLKHSIHLASVHGNMGGKYDYKMYAIYHPDAKSCATPLTALGYELLERNTPVAVQDIQGEFLRNKIEANGCCGEKELIKLEAYTLTEHPVVVHLDLDTLILQPMDSLYDVMLEDSGAPVMTNTHVDVMFPHQALPSKVNAFFTRDYNMAWAKSRYKPAQGGFLVLRPDRNVYNEFVEIVRKGDFQQNKGWGGVLGVFYGSMTFQGLIPYYYDVLHPGTSIELNHCVYNQMADNPRDQRTVNDVVHGNCRTGEKDCEDCRSRPLEEVKSTHYTLCQKPWLCLPHNQDSIQHRLCRKLHTQWFRVRSDLEKSWGRSGFGSGEYDKDIFKGYCKRMGAYERIAQPYGSSTESA